MVDSQDTASHRVINSADVEGTAVYNLDGERLGSITSLEIEKQSGQVRYAIMSFGGFLGIGDHHYPLPWDMLNFDMKLGGYRVDLDKDRLEQAPNYEPARRPHFDPAYEAAIYGYYGLPPYY